MKDRKYRKSKEEREMFLTFWDIEGPAAYYDNHKVFFSPHNVYLLVIDLSKGLDEECVDNLPVKDAKPGKIAVKGKFRNFKIFTLKRFITLYIIYNVFKILVF